MSISTSASLPRFCCGGHKFLVLEGRDLRRWRCPLRNHLLLGTSYSRSGTFYIYWSQIPYFIIFAAFAASSGRTVRRRVEADFRQSRDLLREQASLLSPALRLALIYAFFGAPRILVSDRLSFYLVPTSNWSNGCRPTRAGLSRRPRRLARLLATRKFPSELRAAEEALHRLNGKLQAISNCNQTLLRATDEQSLLEQICRIVCEEAGYRMAFVAFAEHDEAKSVRPVVWSGAEEGYLATVGFTWADTESLDVPHGNGDGRAGKLAALRISQAILEMRGGECFGSTVIVPVLLRRQIRTRQGVRQPHIYSAQPNASTPEEVRLLEELAGDLAFGIVTLRSAAARKRGRGSSARERTIFPHIVDHVGHALFVYDLEEKTIVDVNLAAWREPWLHAAGVDREIARRLPPGVVFNGDAVCR